MTAVGLHDIDDCEKFVRATVHRKPGLRLAEDLEEELVREGIVALTRMAERYEPGYGGRDPAGSRFSGYAAKYLPGKLDDALHRLRGDALSTKVEAVCLTCGQRLPWLEDEQLCRGEQLDVDGAYEHDPAVMIRDEKRAWSYAEQADSLDRIHDAPGGSEHITALQSNDSPSMTLEATLARTAIALEQQWTRDRDVTLKVARLLGEGNSSEDTAQALGIRGREVTIAVDRIRRVAHNIVSTG